MSRHSRRRSSSRAHRAHHNPRRRRAAKSGAIPVVHYAANRPTRRRSARRAAMNPARRHHARRGAMRRNPPRAAAFVLESLKGGALVYGGRVANKKLGNVIVGVFPAPTAGSLSAGTVQAGAHFAAAVIVGLLARMIVPRAAANLADGAMAEAIEQVAMLTPAAPYLSAYARPKIPAPGKGDLRAYPRLAPGSGMAGFSPVGRRSPRMVGAANVG